MGCDVPLFSAKSIDYRLLRECRKRLIERATRAFSRPIAVEHLEELPQSWELKHHGVFMTLYDILQDRFALTAHPLLQEKLMSVTGYTFDEFNIRSINNDVGSTLHITYAKDLPHVVRYNNIVYDLVLNAPYEFGPADDSYTCRYRIMGKNGRDPLHVERTTSLVHANIAGGALVQVDVWRLNTTDAENYVRVHLNTKREWEHQVNALFYEKNMAALGISLSMKNRRILVEAARDGHEITDIANKCGMTDEAVRRQLDRIIEKMKEMLDLRGGDTRWSGRGELTQMARKCGLLPIPQLLLERERTY